MKKLRLALNKGEKLRFLSHLDYAQAVERMIRRAEIKMAYSEGFNPHMKISFSSALALGVTAAAEYIDMDVLEEDSLESIMERLNRVAPPGLEVLGGKEMPEKVKKMMAYEKVTPKKTRTIDVKEFVKEPIVASVKDGMVTLTMGIGIYPQGTIKPSEVWNLGKDQYNWPITSGYEIHRKAIMVENEDGRYTPLEINY